AGVLGRFLGEVNITLRDRGAAVTNARLTPTSELPVDEDFEHKFGKRTIDLAFSHENFGKLEDPTTSAREELQGDYLEIYLKIDDDGIISEATFLTNGCFPCHAAGSQVTLLARGKSVDDAMKLTSDDILKALGGKMPPADRYCMDLAERSLKSALKKYEKRG
ncbi:MAG: iron-sulfur cluster assembly scaffold protein, partial [Candidatus Hodarchaeota archaeon]